MPEQIKDGTGSNNYLTVNADGSINVVTSGAGGGGYAGSVFYNPQLTTPSENAYTQLVYISSGTSTGVTGSAIGSIIKFIGAGSYVKVLSYSNNNLVSAGSWS